MSVQILTNGHSATGPTLDSSSGPELKPSGLQSTVDHTQELIPISEIGDTPKKAPLMQSFISPCIGAFGSSFGLTSLLLAKIMANTGFMGFVISMVLAILVNYVSDIVILKLGEKYKLKSFSELSSLFDIPAIKITFKVVYFALNFGILLSGAVAFNMILIDILASQGVTSGFLVSKTTFLYIVLLHAVMFPLLMKRKLSDLKIVTILTLVACFYLTIFLMVRGVQNSSLAEKGAALIEITYDNIKSIPTAFSVIFFAFSIQVNLFSMYSELPDPSIKNLKPVLFTNFGLLACVYLMVGYFGMMAFFDRRADFQTNRENVLGMFPANDYGALVARILMLITSINTFLYTFKPCKDIVLEYLDDEVEAQPVGPRGTRLETAKIIKLNLYVTIGLALSSVAVGSFFIIIGKNLGDIIDILANLFMPVLFVFIPLAIFARLKVTPPVIAALALSSFCYMFYVISSIMAAFK
jgi:amino acid permease